MVPLQTPRPFVPPPLAPVRRRAQGLRPPPLPAPSRSVPLIYWPAVAAALVIACLPLGLLIAWCATHLRHTGKEEGKVALTGSKVQAVTPSSPANPTEDRMVRFPVQEPPTCSPAVPADHRRPPMQIPGPTEPPAPRIDLPPALLASASASATCQGENYGTSVTFLNNPKEAAREAGREQKLLFVLHISGNFEDSQFT